MRRPDESALGEAPVSSPAAHRSVSCQYFCSRAFRSVEVWQRTARSRTVIQDVGKSQAELCAVSQVVRDACGQQLGGLLVYLFCHPFRELGV